MLARVLSVLQLTRMALVFTALADSGAEMLLYAQHRADAAGAGQSYRQFLDARQMLAMATISVALYGFGMSLNDIIDRRRDLQIAADRPLPSGRIGVVAAHGICALLAALAVGGGVAYSALSPFHFRVLFLVIGTGLLITFYDFAGKYLVALGLLTLGLIRFFHASIACPRLPVIWHPLLLLNHVTILSAVGYRWEQKRPNLTRLHTWTVLGGLAAVDVAIVALYAWRHWLEAPDGDFFEALAIRPELALPAAAAVAFVIFAWWLKRTTPRLHQAGRRLMLYGLLWLILYDAAFVAGYVGIVPAALVLLLLPAAYLSVQLMRWSARLAALSQTPEFKRS
jgi:4-hydroxybenzoate polyprenyltransferase